MRLLTALGIGLVACGASIAVAVASPSASTPAPMIIHADYQIGAFRWDQTLADATRIFGKPTSEV